MKIALILLAVVTGLIFYIARPQPAYYEIEPISGFLIDEETKEPIEGAAVLVAWGAQEGFFIRPQSSGFWGKQYTRTDQRGYFLINGWSRSKRKWFSSRVISDYEPVVFILRSGYTPIETRVPLLLGGLVSSAKQKRDQHDGKEIIKGVKDKKIEMIKLPVFPRDRFNDFYNNIWNMSFFYNCEDVELRNSGFVVEIYQEISAAVQAGLDFQMPAKIKERFLSGDNSYNNMCSLVKNGFKERYFFLKKDVFKDKL